MAKRSSSPFLRAAVAALLLTPVSATLFAPAAYAQSESGRAAITGRVVDATNAAVPDVDLLIVATQTGERRVVKSDGAGQYLVPALAVGSYTITAKAANFAESKVDDIELAVGQTAEINIVLKPAGDTNTVTVTADTDLTHVAETDNATVLGNDVVENLPTRGRNFTDFALLTPGISQEIDRFGLVVNGQRSGNSNIAIDGVDFNDPLQNGQRGGPVAVYFFPQVAVREFQIVRTGASASVGRTNAGFINVVTKSGTNRFHGEGLYSNRNPWLTWPDAKNDPEAGNNQNQYAFGIGGPIFRDKLFFFAGVEKTNFEVPYFVRINTNCPTAGYYDPTGLNPACALGTPGSGTTPLPANITALMTADTHGTNNPLASSARLDWQINDRNTAMLQYMSTFVNNIAYGTSGIVQTAQSDVPSYNQQSQAIILGLTTVLASSRTNDLHVQAVYDNRQETPSNTAAEIDIGDLFNIGGVAGGTYLYRAIREELVDNFSWLLGKHSFKFGADINLEPETQQRETAPNGLWTIDTFQDYLAFLPAAQGGGGQSAASINKAGCGAETSTCAIQFQQTLPYNNGPEPRYRATQREFAGYVEDIFHVVPRLTLNMGFRYEAQLEPQAPANPAVPGTGVSPSDVTMWQPRFGLAWDAYGTGQTVFRASAGLFDARTPAYILQHAYTDNGAVEASINSVFSPSILLPTSPLPPYGSFGSYASAAAVPGGANILNDVYTNDINFRNPRSLQVAAAIEQQLTKRTALVIGFTQQETWKLQHRLDTNLFPANIDPATFYPVFPSINPITNQACTFPGPPSTATSPAIPVPCRPNASIAGLHVNFSTGHATYRSLIAQVKGNFTKRLTGVANFTWASSRDDDSNERDADRELALDPLCTACYNKGYSQQDIRSNFNVHGIYRLPFRFIFSSSLITRTALPYTAVTSGSKQGDFNNDGNGKNDRPILCSQVAFTTCAVSATAINAYKGGAEVGTIVGRNTFRQPGFLNWDMRMIKEFHLAHTQRVQFSAECLNCSRASNLNFGSNATSKFTHAQTTLNPLTGYYYSGNTAGIPTYVFDTFRSGGPRQIQLGARYFF